MTASSALEDKSDTPQRLVFPLLAIARLRLREMRPDDAPGYAALLTDRGASFITDAPLTADLVPAKIQRNRSAFEARRALYWSVTRHQEFVRFVALHGLMSGSPALSYAISRQSRGQGFASEAVAAVMDFAFSELGVECLLASTHLENVASIQVLHALRFRDEGVSESANGPRRCFRFARLAEVRVGS